MSFISILVAKATATPLFASAPVQTFLFKLGLASATATGQVLALALFSALAVVVLSFMMYQGMKFIASYDSDEDQDGNVDDDFKPEAESETDAEAVPEPELENKPPIVIVIPPVLNPEADVEKANQQIIKDYYKAFIISCGDKEQFKKRKQEVQEILNNYPKENPEQIYCWNTDQSKLVGVKCDIFLKKAVVYAERATAATSKSKIAPK